MEIENKRLQHYVSLYFDTDSFKFYSDHHNGKLNRYKVRYRKYTDSKLHFLEVKFKNNKGMTRKKRIKIEPGQFIRDGLFKEGLAFVQKRMNHDPGRLAPKLFVEYSRIALVHKDLKERVTIDINLSYRNSSEKVLEKIAIAEVKQDRLSRSSDFIRLMNDMRIFNTRFSKYCFGINLLYPQVKYNRFKLRISTYNKLVYGTTYNTKKIQNSYINN